MERVYLYRLLFFGKIVLYNIQNTIIIIYFFQGIESYSKSTVFYGSI